jgi:hypothetical protein
MCISWTNKEFEIINARYNHEDSVIGYLQQEWLIALIFCSNETYLAKLNM